MNETIKTKPSLEVLQIAMVCHQANKAWCEANYDNSQKDWHEAEDWQRQSAVLGVKFRLENPNAGHDAQHNAWLEDKKKDGSKATEEDRPDECILIAAKNYCVLNRKRDYFPKIKAKGVSF